MKKAVGHLIPFMEKEREERLAQDGTAENDINVSSINCLRYSNPFYQRNTIQRSADHRNAPQRTQFSATQRHSAQHITTQDKAA